MAKITSARAWANNEVAIVAWDSNKRIKGCLGFEVTRIYLNPNGSIAKRADGSDDRVRCAAWIAFKGQRNPQWLPRDTSVWPVQKLTWRDLTLRKKRDGMTRRPDEVYVRYEIRPVGDFKPGLPEVKPDPKLEFQHVKRRDKSGKPLTDSTGKPIYDQVRAYEGKKRSLGYLDDAVATNDIKITTKRGEFRSTFTNGILAAQWLRNVLNEDGVIEKGELLKKIQNPDDPHRKYLAGDVLPLIEELFSRPGSFYLSLYELADKELEQLLLKNKKRIHVILSNTSQEGSKWDVRNQPARKALVDAGVDIQHRMFNNAVHIGHNKFVVRVGTNGRPSTVLTGSTNWTSTGVAGQTNNSLLVENSAVAAAFLDYWKRMKKDALKVPKPFSKPMKDNQQGKEFRADNAIATEIALANHATVRVWLSPNRPERRKPVSKTKPAPVPPDLEEVYRLMRRAKDAILFLAFYPAQKGKDCIIGEAIEIGAKDSSLIVQGAVSSAQAMPNFQPKKKDKETKEVLDDGDSPSVYDNEKGNLKIVRAARIDDQMLLGDLGAEQLVASGKVGAIIHDKLVVIDPKSKDCTVILGSHNLGFKASYSNDENMLIIRGDRALAEAYAVHILDVYDHYRFRAVQNERRKQGKKLWSGFLSVDDQWQDDYFTGLKGDLSRYLAS